MKNILFLILCAWFSMTCMAQQKQCVLRVNVPQKMVHGATDAELSIALDGEKGEVSLGSLMLKAQDGSMLSGEIVLDADDAYSASALWVDDPHVGFAFILEPGTVTVNPRGQYNLIATGTPLNDAVLQYNSEIESLPRVGGATDFARKDSIMRVYMQKYADTPLFGHLFSTSNAVRMAMFNGNKEAVEALWALGSEKQKRVKSVLNTYNRICKNDIVDGMMFRDVEITNATVDDSRTVRLSDYIGKGKWVFVDFWASWCVGCRQAIPRVKAAYEEVKDKNVMFISIAEWDKRKAALKAMDEEQMPWLQLIDEKGACGEAYMFNAIPRLMLFAPDGTIADKDVDSRKLHEIFAEHLGK